MSGLFIVFEGGDGVGKTTQVRRLVGWLRGLGVPVTLTHEPGDTELGRQIRKLVLDPSAAAVEPRAEALMIAADKAQHLFEVVCPALNAGHVVVCDRYVDSMVAYQGTGRGLGGEQVQILAEWATRGLKPQLTILLDTDPERAVGRLHEKDRLEGESTDFHDRVRDGFLAQARREPDRYLVLPARDSRESIAEAIRDRVEPLLAELSDPPGTMES